MGMGTNIYPLPGGIVMNFLWGWVWNCEIRLRLVPLSPPNCVICQNDSICCLYFLFSI